MVGRYVRPEDPIPSLAAGQPWAAKAWQKDRTTARLGRWAAWEMGAEGAPHVALSSLPPWASGKSMPSVMRQNSRPAGTRLQGLDTGVLSMCGFHCEFTYLLNLICHPQINTQGLFTVILRHM